jgi:cytochrome P450
MTQAQAGKEAFTVDLDPTSPELPAKVFETLADVQAKCPVAWSESAQGFWALTKYDDVTEAAQDWETFTSAEGIMIPPTGASMRVIPAEVDPPRHSALRKLALRHFRVKAIEQWEPAVREIVANAFEPFLARGHADLVQEVARPVPVLVICHVLGIRRDWELISRLADDFMAAGLYSEDVDARRRAAKALEDFLEEEIEARRGKPVVDMLGEFVNAEVDGEPLPPEEALGLVQLTVVAGHETTVNAIGSIVYRIVSEPGLRDRLLADRSILPQVIDEGLRLHPPVWSMARTVRRETTRRGAELCPGEKVMLAFGAANRDPEKFENPNEFDIDRPGLTQHLTFGVGRHRCLGEALAKRELQVVLEYILDTIPDLEIDGEAVWGGHQNTHGTRSLPIKFSPITT